MTHPRGGRRRPPRDRRPATPTAPARKASNNRIHPTHHAPAHEEPVIDGLHLTFRRTYAAEPDTLMLAIPGQLGADDNLYALQAFAEHGVPALGWRPNTEGPVTGYALDDGG